MAALIGGATVHHWAHMPVILEDARDKAHTKNTDGDVDALFEDCLGMRWLLLDEVSTFQCDAFRSIGLVFAQSLHETPSCQGLGWQNSHLRWTEHHSLW